MPKKTEGTEKKRRFSDDISMMTTELKNKSTTAEIRARFDHDVERFSSLETGQQATIDAVLVLELVAQIVCDAPASR
jgi:hypothetical protein